MNKPLIIVAPLLLAAGLAGGYWLASRHALETHNSVSSETGNKPLFYRNPMNSDVISPVPAKDSTGMAYIPVFADHAGKEAMPPGTVKIDAVTEQNIGVRTTIAVRETLSHIVRAVDRVTYDEERLVRLPKNGRLDRNITNRQNGAMGQQE